MLVLSRKECEVVVIGKDIRVTILRIEGQAVRLGFEAPQDVEIHRQEVFDRIAKQKNEDI